MESVITKVSITEKGFSMEDSERLVQLGSRLKEARKRQRLTQAELAQKSGIAPSNISELEHGKTHIQLLTFIKIIEGLQVSADEIIRADTPVVHELYRKEYADLLADCTPGELDVITKFVMNLKATLRSGG